MCPPSPRKHNTREPRGNCRWHHSRRSAGAACVHQVIGNKARGKQMSTKPYDSLSRMHTKFSSRTGGQEIHHIPTGTVSFQGTRARFSKDKKIYTIRKKCDAVRNPSPVHVLRLAPFRKVTNFLQKRTFAVLDASASRTRVKEWTKYF